MLSSEAIIVMSQCVASSLLFALFALFYPHSHRRFPEEIYSLQVQKKPTHAACTRVHTHVKVFLLLSLWRCSLHDNIVGCCSCELLRHSLHIVVSYVRTVQVQSDRLHTKGLRGGLPWRDKGRGKPLPLGIEGMIYQGLKGFKER